MAAKRKLAPRQAPSRKKSFPPAPEAGAPSEFRPSFMIETNGGGRVEAVPGFNASKVLAQGFGGGRVPAQFRGQDLGTATYLEYAFPESLCGQDDRVPIGNTTVTPWRCVCQLVVEGFPGGKYLGTGWLAGPSTLVTAGHNIYSKTHGLYASRIWVFPGRFGDHVPFGYFSSTKGVVHPRWGTEGDPLFDFGAIYLPTPVGNKLGWFGMAPLPDAQLLQLVVNNAGYPADKPIGTQWFNAGRIGEVEARVLTYGLDTEEGQSGSPVFYFDQNQNRIAVAIHAYGGCPYNRGIRITSDVYQILSSWIR